MERVCIEAELPDNTATILDKILHEVTGPGA
jgi:hypothetical protein